MSLSNLTLSEVNALRAKKGLAPLEDNLPRGPVYSIAQGVVWMGDDIVADDGCECHECQCGGRDDDLGGVPGGMPVKSSITLCAGLVLVCAGYAIEHHPTGLFFCLLGSVLVFKAFAMVLED